MRVIMTRDYGDYKKGKDYPVNEKTRVELMAAGAAVRFNKKPKIETTDKAKVKKNNV